MSLCIFTGVWCRCKQGRGVQGALGATPPRLLPQAARLPPHLLATCLSNKRRQLSSSNLSHQVCAVHLACPGFDWLGTDLLVSGLPLMLYVKALAAC